MRVPCIFAIAAIAICPGLSAGCAGDPTSSKSDFSLSAVVNGIVWHPEGSDSSSAVLFKGENSLSLAGLRSAGSYREQIGIHLRNVTGPGTYALGDPATSSAGYFIVSLAESRTAALVSSRTGPQPREVEAS